MLETAKFLFAVVTLIWVMVGIVLFLYYLIDEIRKGREIKRQLDTRTSFGTGGGYRQPGPNAPPPPLTEGQVKTNIKQQSSSSRWSGPEKNPPAPVPRGERPSPPPPPPDRIINKNGRENIDNLEDALERIEDLKCLVDLVKSECTTCEDSYIASLEASNDRLREKLKKVVEVCNLLDEKADQQKEAGFIEWYDALVSATITVRYAIDPEGKDNLLGVWKKAKSNETE